MSKFENILIASDIDGTILWETSYINPKNFEKLRYFLDNGGHFALATGRNHKDIFSVLTALNGYINMPCILCNGSYLYDLQTKEFINARYLDSEKFTELAAMVRNTYHEKAGFRASCKKGFLVCEDDAYVMEHLKRYNLDKLAIPTPFDDFKKEQFFKSVFIGKPEILSGIRRMAEENFSDVFTVTSSDQFILEIQPLGISKDYQFPYLKKMYQNAEIWCIGDYYNDMEMLRGADVAVCPENAVDEIKAIADYQVCHCKDGALAEMIDLIANKIDKTK